MDNAIKDAAPLTPLLPSSTCINIVNSNNNPVNAKNESSKTSGDILEITLSANERTIIDFDKDIRALQPFIIFFSLLDSTLVTPTNSHNITDNAIKLAIISGIGIVEIIFIAPANTNTAIANFCNVDATANSILTCLACPKKPFKLSINDAGLVRFLLVSLSRAINKPTNSPISNVIIPIDRFAAPESIVERT